MATVYAAIQVSVQRPVALKVMSPVLLVDPSFGERFMREAHIAANLHHPHIVSIHDVGVHGDYHYTAMELLPGGDLADRLDGAMDVSTVLRIIGQLTQALDYAQSKGFIHRDVKPENILFREDGSTVLTDFGIARALNSSTQMTKTGAIIGTPQYMSPEQARGREIDGRSDLYALGIVLYEMLIGEAPYRGADSITVGIKHITEPVPALPDKLVHLQPLLNRFLAKDPNDRYQRGFDALRDIKALQKQLNIDSGIFPAAGLPSNTPDLQAETVALKTPPPLEQAETVAIRTPVPRPQEQTVITPPEPMMTPDQASFESFPGPIRAQRDSHRQPVRRRSSGRFTGLLLVIVVIAAIGWWQRERLAEWPVARDLMVLMGLMPSHSENGDATGESLATGESPNSGPADVSQRSTRSNDQPERADEAPQEDFEDKVRMLIDQALTLESSGQLVLPTGNNALFKYQTVLELQPDNASARAAIDRIQRTLINQFEVALLNQDTVQSERLMTQLKILLPAPQLKALEQRLTDQQAASEQQRVQQQQQALLSGLVSRIEADLSATMSPELADRLIDRLGQAEAIDADHAPLRGLRDQLTASLHRRAAALLESDDLDDASQLLDRAARVSPASPQLARLQQRLRLYREQRQRNQISASQRDQITQFMEDAQRAMSAGRLISPPGESAYDQLKAILRIDPDHQAARLMLTEMATDLTEQANEALRQNQWMLAIERYRAAVQSDAALASHPGLRDRIADRLVDQVNRLLSEDALSDANRLLEELGALAPEDPRIESLQLKYNLAREVR